ncbi:MAG: hypothetical protein JWQ07_331 [Ramlibacter sp.]|nr:hypothetical protein [Ramlibacter sp.]
MKFSSSVFGKAAAVALVLAAAGTASVAQARGNVYFSVGANVAPGVNIGVSNGPMFYPPVYAAPVYYQPAPVYYEPGPIVYSTPVYVRPSRVYYGNYYGRRHFNRHPHQVAYVRY